MKASIRSLLKKMTIVFRRGELERQWPDALMFLAGAMKAGLSFEQSLRALHEEAPEPLRSLLETAVGKDYYGWPLERRIDRLFSHPQLALAKAAIQLSNESGGHVAELLEKSATILKAKSELAEKVNTLTAQGRASAWIIGLSPIGLVLLFECVSPDYMEPMFHTKPGWMTLGIVMFMVVIGLFFVHRSARIDL